MDYVCRLSGETPSCWTRQEPPVLTFYGTLICETGFRDIQPRNPRRKGSQLTMAQQRNDLQDEIERREPTRATGGDSSDRAWAGTSASSAQDGRRRQRLPARSRHRRPWRISSQPICRQLKRSSQLQSRASCRPMPCWRRCRAVGVRTDPPENIGRTGNLALDWALDASVNGSSPKRLTRRKRLGLRPRIVTRTSRRTARAYSE